MRWVLGLSLTESSAVWVLVDTTDGKILDEEIVTLDSLHEIARAAARSVQAFDMRTEHDIEGVRLTWSDDARQHGIRLRTKLRLFGFETVETVSQDAAREGRNKTARHLAPHLVLAYGAARSGVDAHEDEGMLRRLTARVPLPVAARVPLRAATQMPLRMAARVPLRVAKQVPLRVAAAAGAAVVVAVGIGLYSLVGPPQSEAPANSAAASAPSLSGPEVGSLPTSAPSALLATPDMAPTQAPAPSRAPEPVAVGQSAVMEVRPQAIAAPGSTIEIELDSTVPETIPVRVEEPTAAVAHLPAQPVAHLPATPGPPVAHLPAAPGPPVTHLPAAPEPPASVGVQPAAWPAPQLALPAPQLALPAPQQALPAPLPPVLSSLFDALP